MNADEFIRAAISQGEYEGLNLLSGKARVIVLISETEVICDKDGIDIVADRIEDGTLSEVSAAFTAIGAIEIAGYLQAIEKALPARDETVFNRANALITDRSGYSYETIKRYVEET